MGETCGGMTAIVTLRFAHPTACPHTPPTPPPGGRQNTEFCGDYPTP